MKNFNNNIQYNNNYSKYPKQNFYLAQNDDINIINIHSSKDDFDYITFRGSIYHNFHNQSNFQTGSNGEHKNILPTENYNYNNNEKQSQFYVNQNLNDFNKNIINKDYYNNINNINNVNILDNNQNIKTRQRAFSQKSKHNKFTISNKYNFNPNNNKNYYYQNSRNNNIQAINDGYPKFPHINEQNNIQTKNIIYNNNQFNEVYPNNLKLENENYYNPNNSNEDLKNKVKNYEIQEIDKYLKLSNFKNNIIDNNNNQNNIINNPFSSNNNSSNNKNIDGFIININDKLNKNKAIIIDQKVNEINKISNFTVESDAQFIKDHESMTQNNSNNNNSNNSNNINNNIKSNNENNNNDKSLSFSKFEKKVKDDLINIKTVESNNSENNKVKDSFFDNLVELETDIKNNNDENENIMIETKSDIKISVNENKESLKKSNEDNFSSINSFKINKSHTSVSYSEANDINTEMSYISEEDFPNEIHTHPVYKSSLKGDLCIICSEKRVCAKGYKCDTCSLILCDMCTSLVLSSHFSNEKHRHSLILMEKKAKCDACQKYINNFCFHCDECDFSNCINCYIPQIKDKIKEKKKEEESEKQNNFHEHYLTFIFKSFSKCLLCEEENDLGYSCYDCGLKMCVGCLNDIFYRTKLFEFHKHQLKIRFNRDINCEKCKCNLIDKAFLFCNECQKNFCINCFNNK